MAKYIPEKHYVGWHNFAEKDALAFMTVHGTDAAAIKRMSTVDDWVKQHRGTTVGPVKQVLDNVPLKGFEVAKEVRRWTTSNVVWRIVDPRGFQLEISSNNMAYILGNCNIKKGVIEDELIWVRDGPNNYLLPTASDEFALYERNSRAMASTIRISDLTVGDRISMLSGETGIYLGMYSCVQLGSTWYDDNIISAKRYHIMRNEADPKKIKYVAKASWKGISMEQPGAEDEKDYSDEINKHIEDAVGPKTMHYVCKAKFDIPKALSNIKTVPYNDRSRPTAFSNFRNRYYFMMYKGDLHRAYRREDSWIGSMSEYTMDTSTNKCISANNQISIVEELPKLGVSIHFNSRTAYLEIDDIKDIDKFMYVIDIDGTEYDLDL